MKTNDLLIIAAAGAAGIFLAKRSKGAAIGATKETNQRIKAYIIDAIDCDGYDTTCNTAEEKLKFLADTFKSEALYPGAVRRAGSYQKLLAEWYSGVPSAFNIEHYYYDIEQLARSWGIITDDSTERYIERITHNWYNFLAAKTIMLFNKHDIDYTGPNLR